MTELKDKRNEEIGHYGQTLINWRIYKMLLEINETAFLIISLLNRLTLLK